MKVSLIALYDLHSMGVRGLHSLLKDDHDVQSLYLKSNAYHDPIYTIKDIDAAVDLLKKDPPDFIGIGVRTPLFNMFKHLVVRIRDNLPNSKIIVGGPHATGAPETLVDFADYVVVGEGENAIQSILSGSAPEGVVKGEPVEDLDTVPFPHYGDCTYSTGESQEVAMVSYNTSRGCEFKCSYCVESCSINASYRRRSVAKVAEDIGKYRELFPNIISVSFSDSIFCRDTKWLKEFADTFEDSGLMFWGNGYAPLITEAPLELVKRAGFKSLQIGVQSGSPYIRDRIFNRKDSLEEVLRAAWLIKKVGLVANYDFIMGNPYDTPETMKQTRDFIKKLPACVSITKFELQFWPGTVITERALYDRYISEDDVVGSRMRLGNWSHTYRMEEAR